MRLRGVARQPLAILTLRGLRLRACEQCATDDLWVRLEQAKAIAVTIFYQLVPAQVREGRLELYVTRKRLINRAHERVFDVVTNAGEMAETDQFPLAYLWSIAPNALISGMVWRQ